MLELGCAAGGAVVGFFVGAWLGDRNAGPYDFTVLFTAPLGGMIGALVGAAIPVIAPHIHIS